MICPNCGNNVADGSTNCFTCGAPLVNNNVQPTPQVPMTNDVNNNIGADNNIFVPQDFKLAGDNDDLVNDLPDAMANVLNKEDDTKKEKKPKKKRKKGLIRKLTKIISTLVFLAVIAFFGYNLYLGYTSPKYDMKCVIKNKQDPYIVEIEREYTLSEHGFVNSFERLIIYNNNMMPMTITDLNNQMASLGKFGYDLNGELEDGKIVVTYYISYYDKKSINEITSNSVADGYTCEPPKVRGFVLPFFK